MQRSRVVDASTRFSDDDILDAWRTIARLTGTFCEPASAAGAALLKHAVARGERCVCVLTGNGLKDADRALSEVQSPLTVDADSNAFASAHGWG